MPDDQEAQEHTRAVQYVRMSTDHQRYSIANQKATIGEYARARGYTIVRTYADAGKSGLTLKGRAALKQLLSDTLAPDRDFDAILVLDVSRWGRFQDPDQAAHYEFICRQANVKFIYCQEAFENDTSPTASIMKQIKRVMAGEYSRELSVKLSQSQVRLAALGFKMGGGIPYGFRRELRDYRGKHRFILEPGQTKALRSDRVVLIPGPPDEVAVVNRIFDMYGNRGMSFAGIAAQLQSEGISNGGSTPWTAERVKTVLKSELCIGCYTYNRTSKKLHGRWQQNPESAWVRTQIMDPIVPADLFGRVQARLAKARPHRHSEKAILNSLRVLLREKGRLTDAIIRKSPITPAACTYKWHFGSLSNTYKLIGYKQPIWLHAGFWRRPLTDDEMIEHLRVLYERVGSVTESTINADPNLISAQYVRDRFGSIANARTLAGLPSVTVSQKLLHANYRARLRKAHADGKTLPIDSAPALTPHDYIVGLKRLLDTHGYLSPGLIEADIALPSPTAIRQAFGSLSSAYELAGWKMTPYEIRSGAALRKHAKLRLARQTTAQPAQ